MRRRGRKVGITNAHVAARNAKIVEYRAGGATPAELAMRYGLTPCRVYQILRASLALTVVSKHPRSGIRWT